MGRQTGKWTLHGQTCACTRSDKCKSGLSVHIETLWGCLGSLSLSSSWKKKKREEKKKKDGIKRENKNKAKLGMCVSGCGWKAETMQPGLVQETPAQPQPVLGAGVGGHPSSSCLPQGHKAPQQPWLHGGHPQCGDSALSRATDTQSAVIVHL